MQRWMACLAMMLVLLACAPAPTPSSSLTPSPSPSPAPTTLGLADLRYALFESLGRPIYCDRDSYPIGRPEQPAADAMYPEIVADGATFTAITTHLGITPGTDPTDGEVLAVYREWKSLEAVVLQPIDGGFGFDYIAAFPAGAEAGFHVTGSIDAAGAIVLSARDPSGPPPCPICLSRGTLIATPDGPVAVQDLTPGMSIWTQDEAGRRVAATVLETGSTPVPATHQVVHLVLADGRSLQASPGHLLPDGRQLGDLESGDLVDGAAIVTAELVDYAGGSTFDVLPSGLTGIYWANDIALGSTLR